MFSHDVNKVVLLLTVFQLLLTAFQSVVKSTGILSGSMQCGLRRPAAGQDQQQPIASVLRTPNSVALCADQDLSSITQQCWVSAGQAQQQLRLMIIKVRQLGYC